MVLRSKSVGEQDVADQQGAFLCREDLTFVGSSFFGSYKFVFLDIFIWNIKIDPFGDYCWIEL